MYLPSSPKRASMIHFATIEGMYAFVSELMVRIAGKRMIHGSSNASNGRRDGRCSQFSCTWHLRQSEKVHVQMILRPSWRLAREYVYTVEDTCHAIHLWVRDPRRMNGPSQRIDSIRKHVYPFVHSRFAPSKNKSLTQRSYYLDTSNGIGIIVLYA
jgi:hypothetical protein